MTIDATYFGYGAGLVLIGYCCGIVLNVILRALSAAERI
jgi:hypothetical protein